VPFTEDDHTVDVVVTKSIGMGAYVVIVKIGGEYYCRSISRVEPDGSMTFFCAIGEGVVLTLLALPLGAAAVGALAGPYVAGAAGLSALGLTFFGGTYHEKKAELERPVRELDLKIEKCSADVDRAVSEIKGRTMTKEEYRTLSHKMRESKRDLTLSYEMRRMD